MLLQVFMNKKLPEIKAAAGKRNHLNVIATMQSRERTLSND